MAGIMANTTDLIKKTFTYKLFSFLFINLSNWLEAVGLIGINFIESIRYIITGKINRKIFLEQSSRFGFDSLPITLLMVGVSGMIIALQISNEMVKQGAGNYVGMLVSVSIVREIGPIMAAFAIISMVGSSMAAEIGTMKVTEQIDAIKVLGVNPLYYLMVPRIVAGFFMMPFVTILADAVGILGGLFTSKVISGLSALNYIDSVWDGLGIKDIFISIIKACIFGGLISLISSSIGYQTEGGAIDVGRATTKAVVWSFTTIVIVDYFISLVFFN